ncbi:MAG: Crp/Fnr family transcriptional regulator, partial [Clostridium perfringens]|nr:Crp/Fnr family transcriptional regulator [Clostridium perfringens]
LSVVIEGKIEIQKLDSNGNILVVATLNRGNVFGENLLFGDRNFYPMSVVAKENSQVLHIKKDYIYKLCSSNEAFLRELLRILSNKALNLSSKLKQVTMKSIREMICNYLLKKYNKEKSTTIKLEFSRKDWADKLGVQRPSLSRELMKMRDAGLIDFSKNIIEIKDLEGLKATLL